LLNPTSVLSPLLTRVVTCIRSLPCFSFLCILRLLIQLALTLPLCNLPCSPLCSPLFYALWPAHSTLVSTLLASHIASRRICIFPCMRRESPTHISLLLLSSLSHAVLPPQVIIERHDV
jgi:hypothetical protein